MAQEWCVLYGILTREEAFKVHTIVCKRQGKPLPIPEKSPEKKKQKK